MGLLLSAAFHLLLIAFYPLFVGYPELRERTAQEDSRPPVRAGTEIVEIVMIAPDELAPPVLLEEEPEPFEEAPFVDLPPVEEAEPTDDVTEGEGGPSIAERLQPRMVDPRLWAPVDRIYLELTDEERAQLLIDGMIRTFNDSLAVAQALSDRMTDWTYTDDEGRRWGLSAGRLHLGDFSVPLPILDLPPSTTIETMLERRFINDDLARGAVTALIRETWAERARAIRARLEAERAGTAAQGSDADNGDGDLGSP